eukprot:SAG31_NODE_14941_length_779_cov_1.057353_2_plen_23_part_01
MEQRQRGSTIGLSTCSNTVFVVT